MRLLILTQKVDKDDSVLGFFHEWIRRLAARCERVEVICLEEGTHDLPPNVNVRSIGKERGRRSRLAYALHFYKLLFSTPSYDRVFVHMNPEYLVLAGWWWRLSGRRTLLWYAHRQVNTKLRIALAFANVVATSAASSFRLPTRKLHILGHGIDTDRFSPGARPKEFHNPLRIVSVGRITPIKRLETLIAAAALLRSRGLAPRVTLIGAPVNDGDRRYEAALKKQSEELGIADSVGFAGAVSYEAMPDRYREEDISVNLAPTGGLDKAVLEGMACGVPTFVSNEGFRPVLGPVAPSLIFAQDDAADLAARVKSFVEEGDAHAGELRMAAVENASVGILIEKLFTLLEQHDTMSTQA